MVSLTWASDPSKHKPTKNQHWTVSSVKSWNESRLWVTSTQLDSGPVVLTVLVHEGPVFGWSPNIQTQRGLPPLRRHDSNLTHTSSVNYRRFHPDPGLPQDWRKISFTSEDPKNWPDRTFTVPPSVRGYLVLPWPGQDPPNHVSCYLRSQTLRSLNNLLHVVILVCLHVLLRRGSQEWPRLTKSCLLRSTVTETRQELE